MLIALIGSRYEHGNEQKSLLACIYQACQEFSHFQVKSSKKILYDGNLYAQVITQEAIVGVALHVSVM